MTRPMLMPKSPLQAKRPALTVDPDQATMFPQEMLVDWVRVSSR